MTKWNKTSEGLPEQYRKVIVWSDIMTDVYIARYCPNHGWEVRNYNTACERMIDALTHWYYIEESPDKGTQ